MTAEPRETAVLDGVLERVTFANPETGYTIARITPDRGKCPCARCPNDADDQAPPDPRSGVVGPDWAWPAEACAQWPVLARDRYTGRFNRPTAAPILVVGNTVDPATPYQDAVAMSHDLADARLLTVDGYGHTALANPSSCVAAAEDSYFVTGTLPPPGTVCHQNTLPFAG